MIEVGFEQTSIVASEGTLLRVKLFKRGDAVLPLTVQLLTISDTANSKFDLIYSCNKMF